MTAEGICQRVGDRVVEASWGEVVAEAGLSHRVGGVFRHFGYVEVSSGEFARQDERGNIVRRWRVYSSRSVERWVWRGDRGRRGLPEERLQTLSLVVSPVCVATNLEVVVNRASLDPGWVAWLMSRPDRAERVQAFLAAPDPFLEVLGTPAPPGTLDYSFINADHHLA